MSFKKYKASFFLMTKITKENLEAIKRTISLSLETGHLAFLWIIHTWTVFEIDIIANLESSIDSRYLKSFWCAPESIVIPKNHKVDDINASTSIPSILLQSLQHDKPKYQDTQFKGRSNAGHKMKVTYFSTTAVMCVLYYELWKLASNFMKAQNSFA